MTKTKIIGKILGKILLSGLIYGIAAALTQKIWK